MNDAIKEARELAIAYMPSAIETLNKIINDNKADTKVRIRASNALIRAEKLLKQIKKEENNGKRTEFASV